MGVNGDERGTLGKSVQANMARAAKYPNGQRRDWSIHLFFRVIRQTEFDRFLEVLGADASQFVDQPDVSNVECLPEALQDSECSADAGAAVSKAEDIDPRAPARAFFTWLSTVLSGNIDSYADVSNRKLLASVGAGGEAGKTPKKGSRTGTDPQDYQKIVKLILGGIARPKTFGAAIDEILKNTFSGTADKAGAQAIRGGLASLVLYDFLRQFAPQAKGEAKGGVSNAALVRSEYVEDERSETGADRTPINIGFTSSGLAFVGVDETHINSFPDAFKDGMAARADLLNDVGPSAPEHWDGELGQKSIHGVISSGFHAPDVQEKYWHQLREQVAAFNRNGAGDRALRQQVGVIFRAIGMEVLHIELGQHAYEAPEPDEVPDPIYPRVEHFGFRDGISQPFVNMQLGAPALGGGNPGRMGSWEEIAPGEIFLGYDDQDGQKAQQPEDPRLRDGGTYMVFRKLKQDVVGFRNYLAGAYPDAPAKQKRLAAEFVGRWQNGTSLVHAPDQELTVAEDRINDFRYRAEDPEGNKCPLGAHVRRSNPRDIGERDSVKRHRILRRGIPYGGPLLPEGTTDLTEDRGLLFIAMNARIDLQFELIQTRWINSGEFLGQVGLGRCPLVGANGGQVSDAFHETGALSPVRNLPAFVTTKGGDYFFVPSLPALGDIASGAFRAPVSESRFGGHTAGEPRTVGMLDLDRVKSIGGRILRDPKVDHVVLQSPARGIGGQRFPDATVHEDEGLTDSIVFVGRHSDVVRVLDGGKGKNGKVEFSAAHYKSASKILTRGDTVLLGTDLHDKETEADRKRMKKILMAGWKGFAKATPQFDTLVQSIARSRADAMLERVSQVGKVDLVQDLAVDIAYAICARIFGVTGPNWLTELAIALPFAKQNVGQLHPDWLSAFSGKPPRRPDVATLQVWSIVSFISLVGNIQARSELESLSRQAGSELMNRLDDLIEDARQTRPKAPRHMIDSFVALEQKFTKPKMSREDYYRYVRLLLAELVAGTMSLMPWTFGNTMQSVLQNRIDLPQLLPLLQTKIPNETDGIYRFIYEINRVNPSMGVLFRRCEQDTDVNGFPIHKGQYVAALASVAGQDGTVFPYPRTFSLHPYIKGPPRDISKYFMFGSRAGEHPCWGRERIALTCLREMLIAASRINGLRQIAGPAGAPTTLLATMIGLPARFPEFRYQPRGSGEV
ncbi:MAG: cytochrome P450 [Hyphomonadaceae bacterium]